MEREKGVPNERGMDIYPGMKLSGLTTEVFGGVLGIYRSVAGIKGGNPATWGINLQNDFGNAVELLRNGEDAEFRYGSLLSPHSKLWIRSAHRLDDGIGPAVTFSYAANLDTTIDPPPHYLSRSMETAFKTSVTRLLRTRGQYFALTGR